MQHCLQVYATTAEHAMLQAERQAACKKNHSQSMHKLSEVTNMLKSTANAEAAC